MKLNGKTMVAVVMMLGALAATGCNTASAVDSAVAPEESAATAPVDSSSATSATAGVEKDERVLRYYAPFGPPAARVEVRGVAPSERHFWAPGYYRYDGHQHVWVGGRWELRRDGFDFVAPHWVNRYGRYEYRPGRWVRR